MAAPPPVTTIAIPAHSLKKLAQSRMHRSITTRVSILAAGLLAACSQGMAPELPSAATLPSLGAPKVVGTPTELYTRIAHGAVTCWFGASGPLKGQFIYHANAEPESKGGGSEIIIFAKDTSTSPDPRALKAFQIGIRPTGGTPELGVENFKVPEPLAGRLKADVSRWAEGVEGCGEGPVTQGWSARERAAAEKQAKKPAQK